MAFVSKMIIVAGMALAVAVPSAAQAKMDHVLYQFSGGTMGDYPTSGLVKDSQGDSYGVTVFGGRTDLCNPTGCGLVFKLTPDGTYTVLHAFIPDEGAAPFRGLILDSAGNLYGTTQALGTGNGGTVFKLAPDGTLTVLYSFSGRDGYFPHGSLVMDNGGNLYGTTIAGGDLHRCVNDSGSGCGTVFKLAPDGTYTVLHIFRGGADGASPDVGLAMDGHGDLYGTTIYGGGGTACYGQSCGTVFKVTPKGKETVLYAFKGGNDGYWPQSKPLIDGDGNLFGTTFVGGNGPGTVFKIASDGTKSTLYAFPGDAMGGFGPEGSLAEDRAGNFYGTTDRGGDFNCLEGGCGVVFKVTPNGVGSVLHAFRGANDGFEPRDGVISGGDGFLYGTTDQGGGTGCTGYGCGVVFKVKE